MLQRLRLAPASTSKGREQHRQQQQQQAAPDIDGDIHPEEGKCDWQGEHSKLDTDETGASKKIDDTPTTTSIAPQHYWPYRPTFNIYRDIVILHHLPPSETIGPASPQPPSSTEQYSDSEEGNNTIAEANSPSSSSSSGTLYEFPPVTTQIMSASMSQPAPPPPPPPMPGTIGAMVMPNWRSHPHPVRESAPTPEQIQKAQFAHLPDKLLNTMGKERKPFTYTPQGVGEKGVLDLSEIRSSRMKQRLLANLHSGDEDEEGGNCTGSSNDEGGKAQQSSQPPQRPPPPPLYQQPIAPMVLPPLNPKMLNRSASPSVQQQQQQQQRKEVRFAPSPILVSDDEELTMLLEKRRQDVESRAKIVENNPTPEVYSNGVPAMQQQQQHATSVRHNGHMVNGGVDEAPQQQQQQQQHINEQLVRNAAEAVQSARKMFAPLPLPPPELDANNNEIDEPEQLEQHQPQPVNIFKQVYQVEQSSRAAPPTSSSSSSSSTTTTTNPFRQIPSPTPVPVCQSPQLLGIEDETESVTELMDRIDDDMQRMRVTQQQQHHHQQDVSQIQGYRSVAPPPPPPPPPPSSSAQPGLDNNLNQQQPPPPPPPPTSTPTQTYMNQPHTSYQPVSPKPEQEYSGAGAGATAAYQPRQDSQEHFTATFHPQQDREEYSAYPPQPSTIQPPARALPQFQQFSSREDRRELSAPPAPLPPPPPPVSMAYQAHPQQQQRAPPSKSSEILSDLLDGLQDEINKFEQMSRETAMSSPSTNMMMRGNQATAPPVPPKPSMSALYDGRNSCPPWQEENTTSSSSSFRCISPSIELLKKTQSTQGYNYNLNPKPFYRPVGQRPEPMAPQYDANNNVSYEQEKSSKVTTVYPPLGPGYKHLYRPREPIRIEFEDDDDDEQPRSFRIADRIAAYQSQTLPRKIKLNMPKPKVDNLLLSKTYEPTDAGRQYHPETGMFSQLPEETEPTPVTSNRMFYGQSDRQTATLPSRKTAVKIHDGQDYVDSESGRTYLNKANMYSQLPAGVEPPQPITKTLTPDNFYVNTRREASCPPARSATQYSYEPGMATSGQPMAPQREQSQPRLTQQQLRKLPPSQRPPEPNPSKYTGSNIPCRSFRLLQLMTGEDIENQYASQSQPARPASSMGAPTRNVQIESHVHVHQRPSSSMSYGRPIEPTASAFSRPGYQQQQQSTMGSNYETDF